MGEILNEIKNVIRRNNIMKAQIHPMLTEKTQYSLAFIYKGDEKEFQNKELVFTCGQNPLTNDWMYWWNYSNAMWTAEKSYIRNVVQGIRKKHKITSDNFKWLKQR